MHQIIFLYDCDVSVLLTNKLETFSTHSVYPNPTQSTYRSRR